MKKIFQRFKNLFSLFSAIFVLSAGSPLFAKAKTKISSIPKPAESKPVQLQSADSEPMTSIRTSQNDPYSTKSHTYFSHIDFYIMYDVETGSPSSLRKAASRLRKSESEYDESEKVLLAVASSIMQMAWPTERVEWETPALSTETSYMGAINSAKKGIYDESTGNVDFLTIVLPSLVILKTDDVSEFFAESEEALLHGIDLRYDSVLANYLLGMLYKKSGMYEKALERLLVAANGAPECFQTAFAYADTLYRSGKLAEASEQIDALTEKYPSSIELLNLNAHVAYDKGNLLYAEENIARVLQQDPNNLEALMFRIRILVDKKDYIHAASLLDVYSRQDSSSRQYLLMRAQIQNDWSKNTAAAVVTMENALKNYPDDQEVLLYAAKLSGSAQTAIGGKTAEQLAGAVLEKSPDNEEALRCAVDGYIQRKQWDKAYTLNQTLLSKRIKADEDFDVIFDQVKICIGLGKNEEAWNLISPVYKANSTNEDVIQSYVLVMLETGRTNQAQTLINQLLPAASAKLKSFLYYRRSFLQSIEANALADLRSSLIANPRNSDSLFRLYQLYYSKKDYRKAQYYLKQVVALNPNDTKMRSLNDELNRLIVN